MIDFVTDFIYENLDCNIVNIQEDKISPEQELIYKIDLLGRLNPTTQKGFIFNVYKDGSVKKQYILNNK